MKLFVLDPHTIHRQGLVTSLESMPGVESVAHAATVEEASGDPDLAAADLVILDPDAPGSAAFIAAVEARVIVCHTLTVDSLVAGRRPVTTLTVREQQVLALIADGHPTREVAEQLCYSERTVKSVLHDVVTKLNARSRSQAVAFAVRAGLI